MRLWLFSACFRRSGFRFFSMEGGLGSSLNLSLEETHFPVGEVPKAKKGRVFNFMKYNRRQVAFHIAYLGEDYHGFAIQEPPAVTIESCLFDALLKTKLIEEEKVNYSRCGRTDKGVSALGQVVSLQVRSNLLEGDGVIVPEGSLAHTRIGDKTKELPYMVILNRNLPADIRVLGWTTVDSSFSARFNCLGRTYKYFFPLGQVNLDAMKRAGKSFIGQHDFRNFCKMDIRGGTTNFVRTIMSFDIEVLDGSPSSPYQMCVATISGQAFLMHQVRCMMAILFLVAHGAEAESIIPHMLDVQLCPRKPQYCMAAPEPLVLFNCMFDGLLWEEDEGERKKVAAHFQELWTKRALKAVMVRGMLDSLSSTLTQPPTSLLAPIQSFEHKLDANYKSILKRSMADTFEEKYGFHLSKKQKLIDDKDELAES